MLDNLKMLTQLGPMMAKAREMQAKIAEVQARLPQLRATGSSGGSLVTVTANGLFEIIEITYAASAPLTDAELLADLTRAAVNQALKNAKELVQNEMQQASGGLDLSAFQNMLGGAQ
jgi:DNA-binding YbaB/EbfC family protein